MRAACSKMTPPDSGSATGACHPPWANPPSGSSSTAPGAWATPSSVTNSVTMRMPTVCSCPGDDVPYCGRPRCVEGSPGATSLGQRSHGFPGRSSAVVRRNRTTCTRRSGAVGGDAEGRRAACAARAP